MCIRDSRYGVTRDEAERFGLPGGGTLELVVEPAPDAARLADLAGRIEAGPLGRRGGGAGSYSPRAPPTRGLGGVSGGGRVVTKKKVMKTT